MQEEEEKNLKEEKIREIKKEILREDPSLKDKHMVRCKE